MSNSSEVVLIPQGYVCPITNDVMVDPVIDPDGNSYEKVAIMEWLKSSKLSPITRKPLDASKLVPNRALKEAIEGFKTKNPTYGLPVGLLPGAENNNGEVLSSLQVSDSLSVKVLRSSEHLMVSVKASAEQEPTTQTSSDICCVVDVSGSMGCEVQIKSASGINESFGLTQLDLVKHAMKTIIDCLTERDRLSLVSFSYTAEQLFDLTVMDAAGKEFAKKKLDTLNSGGGTNLYDGLIKGLDVLSAEKGCYRNSSLFLLTDGVASTEPPRGTMHMMRKYIDEKTGGSLPCTVNTFGFGYNLDTRILQDIAFEGNGTYAFIPDGSFVGTIFINAMSNFLATVAKDITLSIENTDSNAQLSTALSKHYKHEVTSWGVVYRIGSIIYGQSKDILIGYSSSTAPAVGSSYCEYSLKYTKVRSNSIGEVKSVPCEDTVDLGSFDVHTIHRHRVRFEVVNMVYSAIETQKTSNLGDARALLNPVLKSIQQVIKSASGNDKKYLEALCEDVSGQIAMALSDEKNFKKWGGHYLPSIARAHLFQICNNFKDPGVQLYGGTLFERLRDKLHDVFCALPPPTPSRKRYDNYGNVVPTARVNMATFANSAGACFHEDSRITLCVGGDSKKTTTKAVRDVVQGDRVLTEGGQVASVLYVLKTLCPNNTMAAVRLPGTGLRVTHYHPVKVELAGLKEPQWVFPCKVNPKVESIPCEAVYSFVLKEKEHYSVCIDDTWCVTFGHTMRKASKEELHATDNRKMLAHPYFGNRERVLSDLDVIISSGCPGDAGVGDRKTDLRNGVAVITPDCIVRDPESGMICGIKPPVNLTQSHHKSLTTHAIASHPVCMASQ